MRVLVTGGAGFIGRHLALLLVADGHEVRALDVLNPQVHLDPDRSRMSFPGEVMVEDVRDQVAVAAAMAGIDAVVHLAAETGVAQSMSSPEQYLSVNVDGTRVVADASARRGLPFLLASSRAVYGEGAYGCPRHGRTTEPRCCAEAAPAASREADELRPVSVYGETKVLAEAAVAAARPSGVGWAVVRPQNVVGPGQAPHNPYTGVLAAFAARLRQGLPPQVFGDGRQTRDIIDVRDAVVDLAHLLERVLPFADDVVTVNVGSGRRTTLLELADAASGAAGLSLAPEHVEVTRPGDIGDACADLTLAETLGLPAPTTPLSTSVADFLASAWAEDPVDPGLWQRAISDVAPRVG